MKPRSPFIQPFQALPANLPIYILENALLPGGELPLELSAPADLALFMQALRTDQLIGMLQPHPEDTAWGTYRVGCAGRIRQYRERKDGRLNVMLTGVCRYKLIEQASQASGYRVAKVDWNGYENDYETETVDTAVVDAFMTDLHSYFERHAMQADWKVLNELPIEQVVNNLILVLNMSIDDKQKLLESPTVSTRIALFSRILKDKSDPILTTAPQSNLVN